MQLKRWLFLAAAAIPCVALLVFFGIGVHEWWLISSQQIVVIPAPRPGATSAVEVPASRLLPLILGSGMLAAMFGYALLRGSRRVLVSAYLAVFLVIVVTLGACAYTSSSPFADYHELPSGSQRQSIGTWDLGDGNCKGSVHNTAGKPYWVIDCGIKAGFGHCTHGLPLVKRGSGEYANNDGAIVFTLVEGGDLDEKKDGRLVKRYAVTEGQICGVRSPGEAPKQ